jgi:glycosyltransferase involved in cell wall biosynthesis
MAAAGRTEAAPAIGIRTAGSGARVFVVCNTAWSLYHFRLKLIGELEAAGHEVWTVSPHDDFVRQLAARGIRHVAVPMSRKGTNPVEDLLLIGRLHRLFRRHRPDVILAYRAKPNIYCALAARPLGIPVINTITGLGAAFVERSALTWVSQSLYRVALGASARVVFQNSDDMEHFVRERLVDPAVVEKVSGSGIDTGRFAPAPKRPGAAPFVFLFVARLLRDKGIGEYVQAARELRARGLPVECRVLGYFDPGNPAAIPVEQMDEWCAEGVIRYLGASEAVEQVMRDADCVVLPSYYREGLPRTLLEAAAMGKPLITADSPGCRDVVKHGENGFLCRPRDAADLAARMIAMVELPESARAEMGLRNRERACEEYDDRVILRRYVELVEENTRPHLRGAGLRTIG